MSETRRAVLVAAGRRPIALFSGLSGRDDFWGYLFILPQVIGLLVFTLFPVLMSLYLCFTEWDFVAAPKLVGLDNFGAVFSDPVFWTSLSNTALLAAGIVPLTMCLSLGLAVLSNREMRLLSFYKAAFFLPVITASVAISLVWYWLFAPDFGLINAALSLVGIQGPGWLADPNWSKPAIIIMNSWQAVGYYYLLFYAGLKNVPKDYYEAAALDGASGWQQFTRITLPMLSPTTFFVLVNICINVFNIFGEIYVMTRGGPVYSTTTIVMYIYNSAFQFFRMGEAAVASWVLFVFVLLLTLFQFMLSKRWVHYAE